MMMMMIITADFGVSAICENGARRNSFIGSPYWSVVDDDVMVMMSMVLFVDVIDYDYIDDYS